MELKSEIKQRIPELQPENPGSIWPKTTLGALRDDRKLSFKDTEILRDICDNIKPDENVVLEIDQLQIVIFQCRSLEKRLLTFSVNIKSISNVEDGHPHKTGHLCTPCSAGSRPASFIDELLKKSGTAFRSTLVPSYVGGLEDDPPKYHLKQIDETMNQFSRDNLSAYWKDLMRDGNRESHYRVTHIESTLIYDIPDKHPLNNSIDYFIEKVDNELPGHFCWFDRKSRHMTVRALVS